MDISPGDDLVATGGGDHTARLWLIDEEVQTRKARLNQLDAVPATRRSER